MGKIQAEEQGRFRSARQMYADAFSINPDDIRSLQVPSPFVQGCTVEVEGVVKGRLCFTVMDRDSLQIARLGSADLNFAQLWIKVHSSVQSHCQEAHT